MRKLSLSSKTVVVVAGAFCLAVIAITVMVTNPRLNQVDEINLPWVKVSIVRKKADSISIYIDEAGTCYISNKAVALDQIPIQLEALSHGDHNRVIHIHATRNVSYKNFTKVREMVSHSGFKKIGLIAETSDNLSPTSSDFTTESVGS
jgi:biopolymer transport protein TolR